MMTTIDIPTGVPSPDMPSHLDVGFFATASAGKGSNQRTPLFVPRNQAYYWTRQWQNAEAEGLREIAAGKTRQFTSGASAARWLLSDDGES